MEPWAVRDLAELADAIVLLGEDDPDVRELLDRLEAGEISLSETAEMVKLARLLST